MKKIFTILLVTVACSQESSKFQKIFQAPLGTEINQIGSNIPILEFFEKSKVLTDSFFIDTPEIQIVEDKLYLADSYNKRVSVFPINNKNVEAEAALIIPDQGEGYSFERPYKIFVDNQENIFILASVQDIESFEIQNYTNITQNDLNYEEFQEKQKLIPENNFYIYQFSPLGKFLKRIGDQGQAMVYPNKISDDNFGNIYTYFSMVENNDLYYLVKRFNQDGVQDFTFSSLNREFLTNINNIDYEGKIIEIDHFKDRENLVIFVEYQPIPTENNEESQPFIDNIVSTLYVYSVSEDRFIGSFPHKNLKSSKIIGVDKTGSVFLQHYDIQSNHFQITAITAEEEQQTIYHVPAHSTYYTLNDYIIDENGNLYSSILDRQTTFILLRWNNLEGK